MSKQDDACHERIPEYIKRLNIDQRKSNIRPFDRQIKKTETKKIDSQKPLTVFFSWPSSWRRTFWRWPDTDTVKRGSNKKLALDSFISNETISLHRQHIFRHLGHSWKTNESTWTRPTDNVLANITFQVCSWRLKRVSSRETGHNSNDRNLGRCCHARKVQISITKNKYSDNWENLCLEIRMRIRPNYCGWGNLVGEPAVYYGILQNWNNNQLTHDLRLNLNAPTSSEESRPESRFSLNERPSARHRLFDTRWFTFQVRQSRCLNNSMLGVITRRLVKKVCKFISKPNVQSRYSI